MPHSQEYIEALFEAAKEHLPNWLWMQLHKVAFPKSGARARWREKFGDFEKQGFEIQTIVFPKEKWTLAEAREWLSEHDLKTPTVDETENSYRFRQEPPGRFSRIRPLCLTPRGAAPNLEQCRVLAFGGPTTKEAKGLSEAAASEAVDEFFKEIDSQKRRRRRLGRGYMNKEAAILKIDEEKRVVYGVVLDPYIVDTQGDWSPPSEVEQTAHKWMEKSRIIGLRHKGEAKAVPVESFLMPYPSQGDYKRAVSGEEHRVLKFKFGNSFIHSGSWVLGTKIADDETWALVKSGNLGSYSVGGIGSREEVPRTAMPKVSEFIEADWSNVRNGV